MSTKVFEDRYSTELGFFLCLHIKVLIFLSDFKVLFGSLKALCLQARNVFCLFDFEL